jgi:hypothetical protein
MCRALHGLGSYAHASSHPTACQLTPTAPALIVDRHPVTSRPIGLGVHFLHRPSDKGTEHVGPRTRRPHRRWHTLGHTQVRRPGPAAHWIYPSARTCSHTASARMFFRSAMRGIATGSAPVSLQPLPAHGDACTSACESRTLSSTPPLRTCALAGWPRVAAKLPAGRRGCLPRCPPASLPAPGPPMSNSSFSPGRCTLTTTRGPLRSFARYTCADSSGRPHACDPAQPHTACQAPCHNAAS